MKRAHYRDWLATIRIIYYKSAMYAYGILGMKIWRKVLSAVLLQFLIIIISRSAARISRNCANEIARDPYSPSSSPPSPLPALFRHLPTRMNFRVFFMRVSFMHARVLVLRERGRELGVSAVALTINVT